MPDLSPSTPFLDRLSQRLKGQRSSIRQSRGEDTNLPDENPKRVKKKSGFLDKFIQPGSQMDTMRQNAELLKKAMGKK